MDWHPARWSVCLPLLIFRCTIKSRSSLLAPAHPGGPEKGRKRLWCGDATDGVAWSVCLLVSLSVTIIRLAKVAEPIEIPFAFWTRVGSSNHVLDGVHFHHTKGQMVAHCRELSKNSCTDRDAVWDAKSGGSRESCIRWGTHWQIRPNHQCVAMQP